MFSVFGGVTWIHDSAHFGRCRMTLLLCLSCLVLATDVKWYEDKQLNEYHV